MIYNVFGGTLNLAQSIKSIILSKKCKIRSKGVVKKSRDLLFEFWYPLHIPGTVVARNFKFGTHIGHEGPNEKNAKLGQKGP